MIHPYTGDEISDLYGEYLKALEGEDATLCWLLRVAAPPVEYLKIQQAADAHLLLVARGVATGWLEGS